MIKLDELIILQDGLRKIEQVKEMIDFVKAGGFYTEQALKDYAAKFPGEYNTLIAISQFPDKDKYVHDGHHRLVSIYLGGRDYIRDDEYELTQWTFEQYTNCNHELGFWTPFD
jgi:hypothetical protein